jgi:hypothetical protein
MRFRFFHPLGTILIGTGEARYDTGSFIYEIYTAFRGL